MQRVPDSILGIFGRAAKGFCLKPWWAATRQSAETIVSKTHHWCATCRPRGTMGGGQGYSQHFQGRGRPPLNILLRHAIYCSAFTQPHAALISPDSPCFKVWCHLTSYDVMWLADLWPHLPVKFIHLEVGKEGSGLPKRKDCLPQMQMRLKTFLGHEV